MGSGSFSPSSRPSKVFQRVNARTQSPDLNTYIVAAFIALLAAFVPLDTLTSMGTLIAFAIVSLGVIILRRTQPDLPRGYRVPLSPVLPLISVAFCGYLIVKLPLDTWILFAIWAAAACLIYFGYSARNSKLARAS